MTLPQLQGRERPPRRLQFLGLSARASLRLSAHINVRGVNPKKRKLNFPYQVHPPTVPQEDRTEDGNRVMRSLFSLSCFLFYFASPTTDGARTTQRSKHTEQRSATHNRNIADAMTSFTPLALTEAESPFRGTNYKKSVRKSTLRKT